MHKERLTKTKRPFIQKIPKTMIGTILLVVIILLLLGSIPRWPHSRNWGYFPSGILGLIVVVLLILLLLGKL